jgi:NAD(P)-dependent dehydrogenase (short-subunit alcohol dehydrogenase family)
MQAGYKVVGLDLSPQEDPALKHVNYLFRTTDITNVDQTRQVAAHVSSEANGLQVLINNAGIADPYLPEDPMDRVAHWCKVIQTNLTGKQTFEVMHVLSTDKKTTYYHMITAHQYQHFKCAAGAFLLSEALLPHMVPGQSSIIHVSSIRAIQSEPKSEVTPA